MLIVMILTLMKYYDEQSIYLIYIYHSFILNVFLTFFTFLTFIFVVIRFKLVLGHLCQRIEELYMTVTLTCWRAKYGKTVQRIFTSWFGTYFIYICFFLFDASAKKLFVSYYHVLLFCLAAVIVQINTENNIQYLWLSLDIQIKYSWKSIIVS